MRFRESNRHQGRWLVLSIMAASLLSGCQWLQSRFELDDVVAVDEQSADDSDSAAEPASEATAGDDESLDASWLSALADANWVMTVSTSEAAAKHRYRHPLLEPLVAAGLPSQALRDSLSSDDVIVCANAAIVLARAGEPAHAEILTKSVRGRELKLPLRLAAAEALGMMATDQAEQTIRELLADYGRFSEAFQAQYVPELHAELIHAVGRRASADDEAILAALGAPSALPRLEAVRIWAGEAPRELPAKLVDLRTDPDARVRAVVLGIVASHRHSQAMEYLQAGLADHDLNVRRAAIAALGVVGDESARKRLELLMSSDAETTRASALAALAHMHADAAVIAAAHDTSWIVRKEVAKALEAGPGSPLAALASALLADSSPLVQQQMVETLALWPQEKAGPLLLEALEHSGYLARKTAREQLARRWPAAEELVLDAPAERRAAKLAELRDRFAKQYGTALVDAANQAASVAKTAATLVPAAEATVCLQRLESGTIAERRRAADRLSELAMEAALSEESVEQLATIVVAQSDTLIWRSALVAITPNTSEAAFRLAYAGVSHGAPEVRRRACQHLASHGDPRHAAVLLPALKDENSGVVRAAVRALGASGGSGNWAELEALLLASDKTIRVEAAESLARLGSGKGPAALERLALDSDPAVRRQAALVMGQLRDPRFTPALIPLLDDQGGVCQAALVSLAQIAGSDVTRSKDDSLTPPSTAEVIQRWKEWAEKEEGERGRGREGETIVPSGL